MSDNKANHSETRRHDWATPQWLFDKLDSVFGFAIDLCADETNSKASLYIGEDIDLMSEMAEFLVENFIPESSYLWINPPYRSHGGTGEFVARAVEVAGPRGIVCLIPVSAGSRWWERHVWPNFNTIIWPRRFSFEGAGDNAKFDCAICVRWSAEDGKTSERVIEKTERLISLEIGPVTVRAQWQNNHGING